jgi:hypothetical protein
VSNTILNIRFGEWWLHVVRFGDWRSEIAMRRSPITFRHSPYQTEARKLAGWRWFEVY